MTHKIGRRETGGQAEKELEGAACWLDPETVAPRRGSGYPAPFAEAVAGRAKRALGDALGLSQFGVNHVTLDPGAASSQRHWHAVEDEFVLVLEGEFVLVTDAGERVLRAGMAAGFPAGRPDGHQLVNRSDKPAVYLEIGTRAATEQVEYSDIDMLARKEGGRLVYTHKSGEPYL